MSISGKYMEAKIGDTSPVFVDGNYAWTVEESADELDGTTGEDEGYENPDDGIWSATINLKGFLDIATGQYTQIRRGTLINYLTLYTDKDAEIPDFVFPLAKVFSSSLGGEVKGRVEWSAKIKSKGEYACNR